MKSDISDNNTILSTPGGTIALTNNNAGAHLNITHPSGSNVQFTDSGTSAFNSTKYQELTLEDRYSTTYGDNSAFVKGTKETRVEGDLVEFVGPSSLLIQDSIDQWYEAYGKGYGSFKMQWPDNRMNLTTNDYPTNTVFNEPSTISEFVFCSELLDGDYADNKKGTGDGKTPQELFEEKMLNGTEAQKAKEQAQKNLTNIYSNITLNAQSLHSSNINL